MYEIRGVNGNIYNYISFYALADFGFPPPRGGVDINLVYNNRDSYVCGVILCLLSHTPEMTYLKY